MRRYELRVALLERDKVFSLEEKMLHRGFSRPDGYQVSRQNLTYHPAPLDHQSRRLQVLESFA
jgi:hypothetical protein